MCPANQCLSVDSFGEENAGFFPQTTVCRQVGRAATEEGGDTGITSNSRALSQSWHHQASSVPSAVLKEGILLIFIFLEGKLVTWRETVPVAVQVNGSIEGEPGLSAELGDWSRLFSRVLKSFTEIGYF